jgi:hypothetical protein
MPNVILVPLAIPQYELAYDFQAVQQAFKDFSEALKLRKLTYDNAPLVMYFDEVHEICYQGFHGRSPYDELCSVLSDLMAERFVVIFLSTSSQLSRLAPAPAIFPSERGQRANVLLPSPFTELPFDSHVIGVDPIQPNYHRRRDVVKAETLLAFGRPL